MGGNRKFKNERNNANNESNESSDSESDISMEFQNISSNANVDQGESNLFEKRVTRSNGIKIDLRKVSLPERISKGKSKNLDQISETQRKISDKDEMLDSTKTRTTEQSNKSFLLELNEKFGNKTHEINSQTDGNLNLISDITDDEQAVVQKRSRSRSRSGNRGQSVSAKKQRSATPKLIVKDSSEATTQAEFENTCRQNPFVQNLVKEMVAKQVAEELKKSGLNSNEQIERVNTGVTHQTNLVLQSGGLKSPSDSTLYTPAIKRAKPNLIGQPEDCVTMLPEFVNTQVTPQICNQDTINQGLTQLRLGVTSGGNASIAPPVARPGSSNEVQQQPQQQQQPINNRETAEAAAVRSTIDRAILDAERFKATLQQPLPGIAFNNPPSFSRAENEQLRHLRYLDNEDDEFFHTTCHLDSQLKAKIARGEFVELEKLIQKRTQFEPDVEGRMQLVNRDGVSYFIKATDRETKISNVNRWEQAFRVYTTIYCQANPHRSAEILQYVDVIHRAAKIFNWENVARYDYVFRQLMAAKPHRSWAKIYTQMWNINLNEPLKRFQEQGQTTQKGQSSSKKDQTCWRYNKNNCKFGRNCRFEHKCSYCGISGHPATNCHKKNGKRAEKGDRTESKQGNKT